MARRFRRSGRRKRNTKKVGKGIVRYINNRFKHDGEMKQAATNTGPFALNNNAGSYITMNGPTATLLQQGTGYFNRIGDKCDFYGFDVRCQLDIASLAASVSESFRLIVYREKDPEGVSTATAEMFVNSGVGITIFSPIRESMKDRFEIYYDKVHTLNNYSLLSVGPVAATKKNIVIKKRWKTPKKTVYYPNSAAAGIAAIQKGSIVAWLVTEGANVQCPVFSYDVLWRDS